MNTPDAITAGATGAAAGIAAILGAVKGIALDLFGVPLPVILAAATAAFAARSFLPPTSYPKALVAGMVWTLVAVFLSNLAIALAGLWLDKELPAAALAGVALLIAGLGQLLWPVLREKLPMLLAHQLDRFGGGSPK